MEQAPAPDGLPPSLRFLKGLVIVLTMTMIVAVITVVWLLVTRLPQAIGSVTPLPPAEISLPQGEVAQAVTFGKGWTAVVTQSNRILIFDAGGTLRQQVEVEIGG